MVQGLSVEGMLGKQVEGIGIANDSLWAECLDLTETVRQLGLIELERTNHPSPQNGIVRFGFQSLAEWWCADGLAPKIKLAVAIMAPGPCVAPQRDCQSPIVAGAVDVEAKGLTGRAAGTVFEHTVGHVTGTHGVPVLVDVIFGDNR